MRIHCILISPSNVQLLAVCIGVPAGFHVDAVLLDVPSAGVPPVRTPCSGGSVFTSGIQFNAFPVSVCKHMSVCKHVHAHACMYVCTYIFTHTHTHTHTCTHTHISNTMHIVHYARHGGLIIILYTYVRIHVNT